MVELDFRSISLYVFISFRERYVAMYCHDVIKIMGLRKVVKQNKLDDAFENTKMLC